VISVKAKDMTILVKPAFHFFIHYKNQGTRPVHVMAAKPQIEKQRLALSQRRSTYRYELVPIQKRKSPTMGISLSFHFRNEGFFR